MRPYIPTNILMRETPELQKSVAADLQVPDPAPSNIISPEPEKSTKKGKKVENPTEHDGGTGSNDDSQSVEPTSK